MDKNINKQTKNYWLLNVAMAAPSVAILGLLAYLGSFSKLMADDFCSVYIAERLGVVRSIWYWYIAWDGGYSASFLDAVILGAFDNAGISFAIPLMLVAWAISLTWAAYSLLRKDASSLKFWHVIPLAIATLSATLLITPIVEQPLLWWGAMRGYIPPLALFPFYIGVYLYFSNRTWKPKQLAFWYFASFLIVFFNGGFSETFTPVQTAAFFLWAAWAVAVKQYKTQKEKFVFLAMGLLGATLGLIVMALAPGNAHRQAFFPPPPMPLEILTISWNSFLGFMSAMLAVPQKSAAIIGIALAGFLTGSRVAQNRQHSLKDILLILAAGTLLVFCSFPPAAYGQSSAPSEHTMIIPAYIMILTIVAVSVLIGQRFAQNIRNGLPYIGLSLAVFVLLGYAALRPIQTYYAEIPLAARYAEQWRQRDAQIRAERLKGSDGIYIQPIENWMGVLEPNANPIFFVNYCMGEYYDIRIISR